MSEVAFDSTGRLTLPQGTDGRQARWSARLQAAAEAADRRCPDVRRVLPGGVAPPPGVREAALAAALLEFDELRRLDMGVLAQRLGVSRSTLYRQAGDRDSLLGQAIWWRCRLIYALVLDATRDQVGIPRLMSAFGSVVRTYHGAPQIHRFVDQEPQAALRILTGPRGYVQPGVIAITRELLELESEKANLRFAIEPDTLAYAVVRLSESFMYSDVLAVREPDVEVGIKVVQSLLTGALSVR